MAEGNTDSTAGPSGIDVLFQRMKSDLMFELRNIQHGERPVTGQNNRENINKFMSKHFTPTDGKQIQDEEDAEDHRPESVVVEVQGVIERKPVSSVLQSAAFRRQLENVIRGSIQSSARSLRQESVVSRRVTPAATAAVRESSPSAASAPVPRPRRTLATTPVSLPDSNSFPERHSPVVRPRLARQDSSDSISSLDSFSSARSSVDIDDEFDDVDEPNNVAAHIPEVRSLPPSASVSPRQGFAQNAASHLEYLPWNDVSQVRQQELVDEISELLHHRLVSSTLDGNFRATLELTMQNHLSTTEADGQAVQNFIRSLPASGIPRNDFTDLGIPPAQDNDSDNVSVTNFSAHSVPYTQTNTHLNREIRGLKSQMAEMKNMLKLSFDLQMDIQRAIRQEVAAAMSQWSAQQPVVGASASGTSSKPVSDTHCLICLEQHSDCVLYQCGHMCVCYACGRDLISRNLGCPVCRAPIKDVIRAYKTNVD